MNTAPRPTMTIRYEGFRKGAFAVALLCALTVLCLQAVQVQAQTFTVIHNFAGGEDGANPEAGLAIDRAGNLYGTTYAGGSNSIGTVFKMAHFGSAWSLTSLHSFPASNYDGVFPTAGVTLGPDGRLYGTTSYGGSNCGELGCGIVFQLRPPQTVCRSALCPWTETIIHNFLGYNADGQVPGYGSLIFDAAGNLYGTTTLGGTSGFNGTVFELTPSHGAWTETILHSFSQPPEGMLPYASVVLDPDGRLYGTTAFGGYTGAHCLVNGCGTVFELARSGSGETEAILHTFLDATDGAAPYGGLIFDGSGNIFGAATYGGEGGGGTIFELTPANGAWTLTTLYAFPMTGPSNYYPGLVGNLVMGPDGSLYGTTFADGANGLGSVFKLTPGSGGWTFTSLHDFGPADGELPVGGVALDAAGSLYGTTSQGGLYGFGIVWEITP